MAKKSIFSNPSRDGYQQCGYLYPDRGTTAKIVASHMFPLRSLMHSFLTINPGVTSFKLTLLLQILQIFNHTQNAYKS